MSGTESQRHVMSRIRLQQKPLLGLLVNPLGLTPRFVELDGEVLRTVRHGKPELMLLSALSAAPVLKKGLLGTSVTLLSAAGRDIILQAAYDDAACTFAEQTERAWIAFNLAAFEANAEHFLQLHEVIAGLASPSRYPAACALTPVLAAARELDATLLSKLRPELIGQERAQQLVCVRSFVAAPRTARMNAIQAFVPAELERWRDFFDTIESKPLTAEQRLAVVVDEDATLVLAGAGSGKTSVITAKAAYLVKAGIRQADEILLLAFAKNAAQEMSERVQSRAGIPVVARTFHALAYDIIGMVEGAKPALADHASDDLAFTNLIKQILKDLVQRMTEVSRAIIQWFAHFLVEPKTEWDFKTKHEFYTHLEKQDLRTLQGERVKSYEELQIANWLYSNGIEYEYEPIYEHKLPEVGKREYQPDFRLVKSGVYIEHFGVRRKSNPDGSVYLYTAPFVSRKEYLDGMAWKRELHTKYKTTLIETFSYERQEGRLLSALAEKLAPYVDIDPLSPETIYDRIIELNQVDAFSRMLGTFLRKFKSGSYTLKGCEAKAERMKLGRRAKAFLAVFSPLYAEYQRRLEGRIDFEDMINRAASYAEESRYISSFRHILVDEFQDISQGRARLVKALKAQHPDVRIFAVGDDWQSIFRFAGSDIHLMRHFASEFGGSFDGQDDIHRTVDLGRTFRSVDQIAFAARSFVLRNPAQIDKQVIPAGVAKEPAIKIVMSAKGENEKSLLDTLSAISAEVPLVSSPASVLLLGRYRFLRPDMHYLQKSFPRLNISFKTIHASKGLEADHVVLLGADGGRSGFPSEISDDPLLALVSPEEENFENAEERRLMYVAMTRARRTLTIMASNSRPSLFATELKADLLASGIVATDKEAEVSECGECGGRLLAVRGKDGRNWYRCEHVQHCGNLLPACPACSAALPRSVPAEGQHRCSCGACYPSCPACNDGWLVMRTGPFSRFYGCVRYPSCLGRARGLA